MTGQSEQRIRDESARLGGPDCDCAPCFLLRLLDAARAERDSAEKKIAAARVTTLRQAAETWQEIFGTGQLFSPEQVHDWLADGADRTAASLGDQVSGDQRNGRHSTTCAKLVRNAACTCGAEA